MKKDVRLCDEKVFGILAAFSIAAISLSAAQASTVLYGTQFPTTDFGGPCSPCGGNWRHFDLIDLGAPAVNLTGIDFAVEESDIGERLDEINVSFFDTSENLLYSVTQNKT